MTPLAFIGGILNAIPSSWMIAGVVIALGTVVVNNHFDQQKAVIAGYEAQVKDKDILIHNLEEQVAELIIDKDRILVSNSSLEAYNKSLIESHDRVVEETRRIIESDAAFDRRMQELDKMIADEVRQDRINAIRDSRKAELLLRYINSDVECWIINFDKPNGNCVQGIWRPE